MAKSITVNGYTFKESPSGGVLITGPGIPDNSGFGIQVTSDLQNLTPVMIQGLGNIPGVTPAAAAVLSSFTQADVDTIKQALTAPPAPAPAPPPPEPTPPTATDQQNKTYTASGGANDDNPVVNQNAVGATQAEAAAINQAYADDAEMNGAAALTTAGSTVAGKSDTPSAKKTAGPGKRLYNPLSDFSSYNYQITLYMVTPDAYNAFVTSGRTNINAIGNVANTEQAQQSYEESSSGVYIVAQSGGTNNSISNRAPGFKYDYYIDNLEIHSAIANGKSTSSEGGINSKDIKFQIIEPYGFSFISNLKNANNALGKYVSSLPNVKDHVFADRSHYIIGIRFLGYDSKGNIVNNLSSLNGNKSTQPGSTGSFEKYFDIKITNIKFKLDGKATIYNIEAAPLNEIEGFGIKNGRLLTDTTVVGGTVGEMVDDLVDRLNKSWTQLETSDGCMIPNKYNVKYIGPDKDLIQLSSVANTLADSDKTKYPVLNVVSTDQINAKSGIDSKVNGNQRQLIFKGTAATSIVQALQTIVLQSDYIQNAIINLYKNEPEADRKTDDYETADSNSNKTLKWINVSVEVLNLGYDKLRDDWAYEFTYIIQSYSTPFVDVKVAPNVTKYYGPVKRYDYWLTGKNTEVMGFELTYNQLYTTIALANLEGQKDVNYPVPVMVGHRVEAPNQGRLGPALQSQNTYINNLMDPGAYASAKMNIMGDPDWILQTQSTTTADINNVYDRFYGIDGYTINCNNGQVYVEVDIKEAIDYNNNTGLMDINDKFLFFDYPKIYKEGPNKIQGISFQVNNVISYFKGGKFTQQLDMIAGMWADANANSPSTDAAQREVQSRENFRRMERSSAANQGGTDNTTNPSSTKATGFSAEPPAPGMKQNEDTGDWYNPLGTGSKPTGQQTSPTGSKTNKPVADDDASAKPNKNPSDNSEGRPNLIDFNLF